MGPETGRVFLKKAGQRFGVSRQDCLDRWLAGIDRYPRFAQPIRNGCAQFIPDHGKVPRRDINADTLGKKAVQPGNACSQRIVDDAVQQPVGDQRELDFRRPNRIERQYKNAVAA
jgi:hypothetical protein